MGEHEEHHRQPKRLLQRNVDQSDEEEEDLFADETQPQAHYSQQGQGQPQQGQGQEQSEEEESDGSDDGHDYGQSAATPQGQYGQEQYAQGQQVQYGQHGGYEQNQQMVTGSQEY